jgi:hypothetical protein
MQGMSAEMCVLMFPCDESHSAFISSVLEELGIGTDFGSLVALPVESGRASYRYQARPTLAHTVLMAVKESSCVRLGGLEPCSQA